VVEWAWEEIENGKKPWRCKKRHSLALGAIEGASFRLFQATSKNLTFVLEGVSTGGRDVNVIFQ